MLHVYIETYGCQMNVADSEVVAAILQAQDYIYTSDITQADVVLLNTCSIRDNAEQRIHKRLSELQALRKRKPELRIGVLGCMAERLNAELLTGKHPADFVAGPDEYRKLPSLLDNVEQRTEPRTAVELSDVETYSEIRPLKIDTNGVSAFISIMRGCNNFCAYCVVPYTRGRERSRSAETILNEATQLWKHGYKEVTLLGQNVNSYHWERNGQTITFAHLLEMVAKINPRLRVRFSTSHPKDISDELIDTMARNRNICRCIHLPLQSGSNRILKLMNRSYTREWYLERVDAIMRNIPDCSLTTDIIAGFCTETYEDHRDTVRVMEQVGYDSAFMFKYSERPGTLASKKYKDDVSEEEKTKRLEEIIAIQQKLSMKSNREDIGKTFEILVEGESKRSDKQLFGRTSQNKVVIFDRGNVEIGTYVKVQINDCSSATLFGTLV